MHCWSYWPVPTIILESIIQAHYPDIISQTTKMVSTPFFFISSVGSNQGPLWDRYQPKFFWYSVQWNGKVLRKAAWFFTLKVTKNVQTSHQTSTKRLRGTYVLIFFCLTSADASLSMKQLWKKLNQKRWALIIH